jgi:uncharacterized surface protein with fasciclin (FAS1) repeats
MKIQTEFQTDNRRNQNQTNRRRKMKRAFFLTATVAIFALFTAGVYADCGAAHEASAKTTAKKASVTKQADIVETAVAAGSFNTLVTAVKAAGLVDILKGEGPFTVFAPTDEAFAALPECTVDSLLNDKEALTAVLTYHVVSGDYKAKEVAAKESLETVNGQSFKIKANDAGVMVDQAKVVSTDIMCSNGVIHVIDSVILPEMES